MTLQRGDKWGIDGHKLHYHPERIAQYIRGDKVTVYPIYVEISPVGQCNHRCTFCAVDYIGYKKREISLDTFARIIPELGKKGIKSIMYAGEGEPLLHPKIAEIVNLTKENGVDVAITTNGSQMKMDFITSALNSISWIKVSLNAGTAETYEKVHRVRGSEWEKVWRNIAAAVMHKKVTGCATTIGIQTVVLPENVEELETLVLDAKMAGVDYVVLKPYSQHLFSETTAKRYGSLTYPSPGEMAKVLGEFSDDNFSVITRVDSMEKYDKPRDYKKCYSTPFFWAYIMANGDVYGCSAYLTDDRFNYGNINSHSFEEIWEGEKRRKCIDFVEKELDISECRKNCRMDKVNRYLWDVKNPGEHRNFI